MVRSRVNLRSERNKCNVGMWEYEIEKMKK